MERQQCVGDIAAYVSELAESVAQMQAGFRTAHAEMARGSKTERRQFVEGIVAKVSALAEDVAAMQTGIRDTLAQMAEAGQSERADFLAGLTRTVDELKRMVAEMRRDFIDDLEGARHAWSGQGQRSGRKNREPVRRQAASAAENAAAATVRAAVEKGAGAETEDDLTVIPGIGPGRMERMREAGIITFARLAQMQPDELRAVLGPPGKMVEVESWIERARDLARPS
jgi:predicted flap endonuclease-1-like 5' DNA nuclease